MKLTEIFDPEVVDKTINKNLQKTKNFYGNDFSKDSMGYGLFSFVRPDKRDPHLISKRHKNPEWEKSAMPDLFIKYAEMVMDEKLWNMIHFPRIYKLTTLTDVEDKKLRKWKIEKLYDASTLNHEEVQSLMERYFGSGIYKTVGLPPNKITYRHVLQYLANTIKVNDLEKIKDETLLNACKKLIEIKDRLSQKTEIPFDLGYSNIMIRRTKFGPEVVFSDPFA